MTSILVLAAMLALPAKSFAADEPPSSKVEIAPPTKKLSPAETRANELDRLFGKLHGEAAAQRYSTIEQRIWSTWMRSDSIAHELLLGQASRAMTAEEFDSALQILDELIDIEPAFAEAYNKRATLYFKMRRLDQAEADIQKALELEPRHFGALAGRAMIHMEKGEPEKALEAYREALDMHPHMPVVQQAVKQLEKDRPDL